jgi:hypothetical protein
MERTRAAEPGEFPGDDNRTVIRMQAAVTPLRQTDAGVNELFGDVLGRPAASGACSARGA